jgi:hypothetical protein
MPTDNRENQGPEFGPSATATFLYYFASSAVAITFVMSRSTGLGIGTGIPEQFGAIGGLIAGGLGVYFNRAAQFSLPLQGRKKFLNELDTTLAQYGYQPLSRDQLAEFTTDNAGKLLVYERSGASKWLSGRIFVQITADQITFASRAGTVRALKKIFAA